jgi:antitoxin VapB
MALNIKDDATDQLARELARQTGESITVATRTALRERLDRVRRSGRSDDARDLIQGVIDRGRARRVVDDRPEDEILGYDEHGLPA